jgi:hypothetical protein
MDQLLVPAAGHRADQISDFCNKGSAPERPRPAGIAHGDPGIRPDLDLSAIAHGSFFSMREGVKRKVFPEPAS